MILYHVNTLEQIAALFDQQREQALRYAVAAVTKTERLKQEANAVTWRGAATILRQTQMHSKEIERQE